MTKSLCERRAELAPLKLGDFMTLQGRDPLPVMFVYIKPGPLDDGRVACDPASPPGDRQVLERVEKWWQVKKVLFNVVCGSAPKPRRTSRGLWQPSHAPRSRGSKD